jgi:GT2 family glycosyltransferase
VTAPLPSDLSAPDVSVIVVNHNGMACLPAMIDSLARAFVRHRSELIVVDNASSDGSREWLRRRGGLRRLELDRNTGFTGGNNAGAALARGRVLLLLNSDVLIFDALDALVDAALQPAVGAVGCRMQDPQGRLRPSIGLAHTPWRLVLSWLGWTRRMDGDAARCGQPQTDVAWVSGACLATRREVWDRLGGLDDEFFMYVEDVDYCRRVHQAGWRVAYLPRPAVTHLEAGGRAWPGRQALLRTVRGYHLLLRRSRGQPAARTTSAALALVFALRAAAHGWRASRLPAGELRQLARDRAFGHCAAAGALWRMAWTGSVAPP